ncbi:DASH complex subunit Dad3-domain-containing protein [Lactarius psammicola]|nr:DASH complex subunit Dad3-domain-containing protein [Lactarius psammicola]
MTMSATSGGSQIFTVNPYEDHPSLSPLETEVLWEYAKLNQHIKDLVVQTRTLNKTHEGTTLERLRVLERKMGLVLTLFKASVWGVMSDQSFSAHPQDDSVADIL